MTVYDQREELHAAGKSTAPNMLRTEERAWCGVAAEALQVAEAKGFTAFPNTSGIEPLDVRVLVLPDPVEEVTKGGIILAPTVTEKEKFATVKATLVAVGVNAFAEAKANPAFAAPQPGARVMIAKYGGVMIKGDDGNEYRLMNDEDVVAVLKEAA